MLSVSEVIELKDAILWDPSIRGVSHLHSSGTILFSLFAGCCYFALSFKWMTKIDYTFELSLLAPFMFNLID